MAQEMPGLARECRIGVTGHRFLADLDRIHAGLQEAFRVIQHGWPRQRLVVLSALAEGADRLVAEWGFQHDARLLAALPFSVDEYQKDFATPESRAAFRRLLDQADEVITMPPAPERNAAYAAVGYYVLDHCDVLLALWDGQEAQGQGGTAQIVAEARSRGKPLIIVRAGNRKPGTNEPTTLGPEQGRVLTERLES